MEKNPNTVLSVIAPVDFDFECSELFYFLSSSGNYRYMSFLDSSLVPNKYSKYSYVLFEPDFAVKASKRCGEIIYPEKNSLIEDNPFKKSPGNINDFMSYFTASRIFKNSAGKYAVNNNICLNSMGESEIRKIIYSDKPQVFLKNVLKICNYKGNTKYYYENGKLTSSACSLIKSSSPDFTGGLAGFISYDYKNYLEKLPKTAKDDQQLPVFYFLHFCRFLAFSHQLNKWFIINNYNINADFYNRKNSISKARTKILEPEIKKCISGDMEETIERIKNIISSKNFLSKDEIFKHISKKYGCQKKAKLDLKSNLNKDEYKKAVNIAKKYIHEGDIYQVNMTQRFKCSLEVEPYDLYFILRTRNAAPFSAYLSFPDVKIGSSSPERFLFLKKDKIQTRPIKGTRPRGKNAREDAFLKNELKNSLKDHAELNMIVDLERNDLGKFCKYGTVKVKEHAVVEKYAKVFHLVSTVTGKVQYGYDVADILKATFPGGSITGAPKIRAMEIIDELETITRGVYTGAIGYIGIDGTMDLNIVIRTFVIKNGIFYYNVGGGIVEDSSAEEEYQETLDKGLALKETLEYFTGSGS